MENLFHRVFESVRLNITIHDRLGHTLQPREWFLGPLFVINEAVARLKDGSITDLALRSRCREAAWTKANIPFKTQGGGFKMNRMRSDE